MEHGPGDGQTGLHERSSTARLGEETTHEETQAEVTLLCGWANAGTMKAGKAVQYVKW